MKPRLRNKTKHYKDGKESQPWLQAWWDVAKVPVLRGWKISSRLPWAAKQDPISRKQFKKKIAYEMKKKVQSDNTWKLFWPNQKVVASRLLCIFQTGHTWHPLHPGPDTLPSSATQMSGILLHSYWLLIFPTPTVIHAFCSRVPPTRSYSPFYSPVGQSRLLAQTTANTPDLYPAPSSLKPPLRKVLSRFLFDHNSIGPNTDLKKNRQ